MENTFCLICLKTNLLPSFSSVGGGGEDEDGGKRREEVYSGFCNFAKNYLKVSPAFDDKTGQDNQVKCEVSNKDVKDCLCDECGEVARSICQDYLELLGIQLRLSWKLGELGILFDKAVKSSSSSEFSSKSQLDALLAVANQLGIGVGRTSHLAEVREQLKLTCAQKGREYLPLIRIESAPATAAYHLHADNQDEVDTRSSRKQAKSEELLVTDAEGDDWEEIGRGIDIDNLVEAEGKASDDDWCPSGDDFPHADVTSDSNNDEDEIPDASDDDADWSSSKSKAKPSVTSSRKRKRRIKTRSKPITGVPPPKRRKSRPRTKLELQPWDCELCGPTTTKKSRHLTTHENELEKKNFQCWFCFQTFALSQSREYHVKSNHYIMLSSTSKFLCQVDPCVNTQFATISEHNAHLKTHLTENNEDNNSLQICSICEYGFINKNLLELHKLLHIPPKKPNGKPQFKCPRDDCDLEFPSSSALQGHFNMCHGSNLKLYKCSLCGISCSSSKALVTHRRIYHKTEGEIDMLLTCSECDKKFHQKFRLDHHFTSVHKPLNCNLCPEKFIGSDALQEHQIKMHDFPFSHETTKKTRARGTFPCNFCDSTFFSKAKLRQHLKLLHPDTSFNCHICQKVLKTETHLSEHLRWLHNYEPQPHICPHCGKIFMNPKYLGHHIGRLHPELVTTCAEEAKRGKVRKCPHCEQTFLWKYALDRHMIREHKGKDLGEGMLLECHICGVRMPTGYKMKMEYHMETHLTVEERREKGLLHICHVCGKEFRMRKSCQKHSEKCQSNSKITSNLPSTSN